MNRQTLCVLLLLVLLIPTVWAEEKKLPVLLLGDWVGDIELACKELGLDINNTDDFNVKMIQASHSHMKCTFGKDTVSLEMQVGDKQDTAQNRYAVLEVGDNTVTIENLDGPKKGRQAVVTFFDDSHISIVEQGKQSGIYLKKVE